LAFSFRCKFAWSSKFLFNWVSLDYLFFLSWFFFHRSKHFRFRILYRIERIIYPFFIIRPSKYTVLIVIFSALIFNFRRSLVWITFPRNKFMLNIRGMIQRGSKLRCCLCSSQRMQIYAIIFYENHGWFYVTRHFMVNLSYVKFQSMSLLSLCIHWMLDLSSLISTLLLNWDLFL